MKNYCIAVDNIVYRQSLKAFSGDINNSCSLCKKKLNLNLIQYQHLKHVKKPNQNYVIRNVSVV